MQIVKFKVQVARPSALLSASDLDREKAAWKAIKSGELDDLQAAFPGEPVSPETAASFLPRLRELTRRAPAYMNVWGKPGEEADAFTFQVRIPTMADTRNIAIRTRELAAHLRSNGVEDALAYADMLAGQEIFERRVRDAILSYIRGPGAAITAPVTESEQKEILTFQRDLPQLARAASVLRPILADVLELDHINETLASLDLQARWEVLSDLMPASHRVLDEIPGWPAYGQAIVDAYRSAERQAMQGFMTPSPA